MLLTAYITTVLSFFSFSFFFYSSWHTCSPRRTPSGILPWTRCVQRTWIIRCPTTGSPLHTTRKQCAHIKLILLELYWKHQSLWFILKSLELNSDKITFSTIFCQSEVKPWFVFCLFCRKMFFSLPLNTVWKGVEMIMSFVTYRTMLIGPSQLKLPMLLCYG